MPGVEHAGVAEAEIDAVIGEFDGDMRAAIAALLHDLSILAEGAEGASRGYIRRDMSNVTLLGRPPRKSP